jgi:hypothetical protein
LQSDQNREFRPNSPAFQDSGDLSSGVESDRLDPSELLEAVLGETAFQMDGQEVADFLTRTFANRGEEFCSQTGEIDTLTATALVEAIVCWKFRNRNLGTALNRRLVDWLVEQVVSDPVGRRQLENVWGALCLQIRP